MERINERRPSGIGGNGLRAWGMIFLTLGVFGRGILQGRLLGIGSVTGEELLTIMNGSGTAMTIASISLVLQAVETCAAPIFAFLLVEGVVHTSSMKNYLLRMLGLAAVTEIPYNLAISGKVLDMSGRNPMFGMVLCLILLWFFRYYAGKGAGKTLIKIVVTIAAVLWAQMLRIGFGAPMVILTTVIWFSRRMANYRVFLGAMAAVVCTLFSPFFLASPMGFLAVHLYNGEPGEQNRWVRYLTYPVILLIVGLVRIVL